MWGHDHVMSALTTFLHNLSPKGGGHWSRVELVDEAGGTRFKLETRPTKGDGMCGAHAAFGDWSGGQFVTPDAVATYFGYFDKANSAGGADARDLVTLMVTGMVQEIVVTGDATKVGMVRFVCCSCVCAPVDHRECPSMEIFPILRRGRSSCLDIHHKCCTRVIFCMVRPTKYLVWSSTQTRRRPAARIWY